MIQRVAIFSAMLFVMLGGTSSNPVDSATPPVQEWLDAQAAARQEIEFARVLDIVRHHRPSASDAWRHTLATAIVEEARAELVDPLLVAAIVAKESSFKSRVVSRAGAVGLMQLRPWVAEDLAMRTDVEWHGLRTLQAPRLNVRLGLRYYKELVERFGDQRVALTAYCFGPSRVSTQLREGTFRGSRYAREILDLYASLDERRWI